MKLYKHQQDIIDADPKKTGLFLGTGSGKTRIALMLARGRTLVIAPKTQVEDKNWQKEFSKICEDIENDNGGKSLEYIVDSKIFPVLTVISKETFRRDWAILSKFDTVIVDEAHTCLGVTPNTRQRNKQIIPKTSQLFETLQWYIEKNNPGRLYLCTATIMRSPMTVWGAAKILGADWDFYKFRQTFYVRLPMPGREVWTAKTDDASKDRLAETVRKLGYVGRLEDWFDVPDQNYKTIDIELTEAQKKRIKDMDLEYPEPIVKIGKIHQIENGVLAGNEYSEAEYFDNGKIEKIKELALEFPRMVVFAKYTAQIKQIEEALSKNRPNDVLTLTGATKERGAVLASANFSKNCILIVQAQISAGWELPEYPVMVFASRTYSFVDYDQAIGRIQRANNIKKNLYINLNTKSEFEGVGKKKRKIGGIDEAVDACLSTKQDFSERLYLGI